MSDNAKKRDYSHLKKYQFGQPGGNKPRNKKKGTTHHKKKLELANEVFGDVVLWDWKKKRYRTYEEFLNYASEKADSNSKVLIEIWNRFFGTPERKLKIELPTFVVKDSIGSNPPEQLVPHDEGTNIETYALPSGDDNTDT